MARGRKKVGHEDNCFSLIIYLRKHHLFRMSVHKPYGDVFTEFCRGQRFAGLVGGFYELKLPTFFYRDNIFFQKLTKLSKDKNI